VYAAMKKREECDVPEFPFGHLTKISFWAPNKNFLFGCLTKSMSSPQWEMGYAVVHPIPPCLFCPSNFLFFSPLLLFLFIKIYSARISFLGTIQQKVRAPLEWEMGHPVVRPVPVPWLCCSDVQAHELPSYPSNLFKN
jgi:hypothetical protein